MLKSLVSRRVILLTLLIAILAVSFNLSTPQRADARPANGVYTMWFDYVGGPQVGEEGTYCDGTYYAWGRMTTCYKRGDHCSEF